MKQYKNNYYNNEPQEQEAQLEDAITEPDLSNIESTDPSLSDGFRISYNKEVPLDIKIETEEGPKDIAQFETINVKLLSDAANDKVEPTRIKVELSWESDLFFHYTNIVNEETFSEVKKKQNLNIGFKEYANLIEKICEDCINLPDTYLGVFTIRKDDGISELQFVKVSDFKDLDLIMLEFKKSSDEIIHKDMLYRFSYLKSKLEYDKKMIKIAGDVITKCNPDIFDPILESNNNYNIDVNKFFGDKQEQ